MTLISHILVPASGIWPDLAGRVLGDWQLNMIAHLRSGFPVSVGVSGDICNCAASGQLAQQVGDRAAASGSREQWFNTAELPSRFAVRSDPAAGTFWTAQAGRRWISRFQETSSCGRGCGCSCAESSSTFTPCELRVPGQYSGHAGLWRHPVGGRCADGPDRIEAGVLRWPEEFLEPFQGAPTLIWKRYPHANGTGHSGARPPGDLPFHRRSRNGRSEQARAVVLYGGVVRTLP